MALAICASNFLYSVVKELKRKNPKNKEKNHPNKTTLNQITYSFLFVQYSINVLFWHY